MVEVCTKDFIARRFDINGIVQGVGFRPHVYRLAKEYDLKGEIANTSSGVRLHIEGPRKKIDSFARALADNCPPLIRITNISSNREIVKHYKEFSISKSINDEAVSTLVSPDISICPDCLKELLDPEDRRYKYPFINCTNCGPRYTIIDNIPYDRPYTSMKYFQMCEECQSEYDDPYNRRFHAQPNACSRCGPSIILLDRYYNMVETEDPVKKTAELLKEGKIIAIKGLGGFHLVADAENHETVRSLRNRKNREEKPLAVMSLDVKSVREYACISQEEEILIQSCERPIVLLKKKEDDTVSPSISPNNKYYGVMLPYTPLHYLILQYGFKALVMTSANMSEEPIVIDNREAFDRLSNVADYFLTHNRDIYLRSDDSVARIMAHEVRIIRRSRGYVPTPVFLKKKIPAILACGAELKNTICLTRDNWAFLSQHIGDLENLRSYDFFKMTIEHLKRILMIEPEIIAFDLHPDYLSSQYALEQEGVTKIQVQHHHAHIAGCMAEHDLNGEVIGLSFDGAGLGPDGTIWGGEVLVCDTREFKRVACLSCVPMPGSNTAVKEPWRMAISYLYDAFDKELWNLDLPLIKEFDDNKKQIILKMITRKVNSPPTSSLGRLFDGVSAIMGIRNKVSFEGQAAMELEMMANEEIHASYEYSWNSGDPIQILTAPIIRGVVKDMINKRSMAEISAKFHNTVTTLFSDLCDNIRKDTDLNRVVMSGGVFQNSILLAGLIKSLKARGFEVFAHSIVPTNDGGICLGQAVVAAARVRN